MTKSALFSPAWLHWPHMMNALLMRERETNRACCCWCSQLMTTHHATEGFARRRSAHHRVSTNSGIALKTWGPAYCDFWSLFKLIKRKKKTKNTASHCSWCVNLLSFVHPSVLRAWIPSVTMSQELIIRTGQKPLLPHKASNISNTHL